MPRTKSAKKSLRRSQVQRRRNQPIESRMKTAIRSARAAVASGAQVDTAVRSASRVVDKAVSKGVLHPNAAARRKSRLTRLAAKAVK